MVLKKLVEYKEKHILHTQITMTISLTIEELEKKKI